MHDKENDTLIIKVHFLISLSHSNYNKQLTFHFD